MTSGAKIQRKQDQRGKWFCKFPEKRKITFISGNDNLNRSNTMQTVMAKKKMVTVTSRQINEAANSIMADYTIVAKDWAKQAADVAANHYGICEIEADSVMAREIKALQTN